jgi:tRNA-2-methylthio-N6-dimethylallyladenosine synthase
VNTYGRDVTVPDSPRRALFADLLRAVDGVEGIRRIRFTSPHPHDFTPDVIDAMARGRNVCEHIHFPLQSGSDRVLRAMQRSYRRERYLEWLQEIRAAVPGIAVTTDVIVGFPGETEEDFEDTLEVVARARFDQAYTFQYSPRPGTRAAQMQDQVPKGVVQARFDRLVALQESISLEVMREHLGQTLEILVEGEGRKGGVQGRTRTNKVVHLDGPVAPGTFLDVRIVSAHPHHLIGEPVVREPAPVG